MRKFFTIVLLLTMAALAYFGYAHYTGAALPVWGLPLGGQKALIRARVTEFFESVRFKNTQVFKNFVASDIQPEDITQFLSQTLGQPAHEIDLQSVKIKDIELDSSQSRARVRIELVGQRLNDHKVFNITRIIFLYLDDNKWLLDTKNIAS